MTAHFPPLRRGGRRGGRTLGLAALAQGEPGDAAGGQFFQDLVGGELGVEDQQAGVGAGGVLPVVSEGDDLGSLLGFGDVGVGVHHVAGRMVLGEEREDGAGALGAAGHVVLFQHGLVAVVADGVEVAVEPRFTGGQAEQAQRLDQPGQQFLVGVAADPPGVGAQVGGLGQRGQAEGERQPFVIGQCPSSGRCGACGSTWPAAASRSTARLTVPLVAGSAGLGDQVRQGGLGDGGQQEQQRGVIARQRHRSAGQPRSAAALTGSSRASGPRRLSLRRSTRGSPSASRICQQVCARARHALPGAGRRRSQ